MARVLLPKRSPTPSESEDETEVSESSDGTSESEEEETSDGTSESKEEMPDAEDLTLPVGAAAEVRSDDPGFVGSFYDVTVTGHLTSRSRGYYTVVYSTLVAEDGGPLEETIAAADVRPRPPRVGLGRQFKLLEAVEAFHNDGWWAGVVSAVPSPVAGAPKVYEVAFPMSRETLEFEQTALRPHRVFQAGRWVPAADMEDGSPLFCVGTQVEVSRYGKKFGESWSPARVLKAIGATTFLVQYTHMGEDKKRATEIIDSQYIRPVCTSNRVSRTCYVEVMHEGSWWPGVVREVLGSGSNRKYVVKLKSYETEMDDVEFPDVLIVGYTQLRPHFDWDGKNWVPRVHRMEEGFVNGTKLTSLKQPSSSAFPLYKEVGESSAKNGSPRGEKLKSADVVTEQTSLPVCIDNYEIMNNSSSYPEETMKKGESAVALGSQLAPPSLPSVAGFAHLSGSSLTQSISLKQASFQKSISPSAPVSQSRELQASLSETFGQPMRLLQGPLLGMQSLNPPTEFVNGTKIISRKRPSSSALPLYREVVESSAKNRSYGGKRLKSADVVSEPTSSPGSIMHKSSCYPGETMTQGNAAVAVGSQLAPPSLPSMAGFAHLSDSSLAQITHLEQASSQKNITPSTPVSLSRELQASMFGTFGQPRPLPQGPLFGKQSLDSQTDKKGTAAKSINEARDIVSFSADVAKPKNTIDNVELGYNVTAGCGMISEGNTLNCVHSTTTPKNAGGSEHAVSPQGGGSAMDERLSESLAIQHLPFVKTFPLWPQIDAMDIFSEGPQQRPHLNQFRQHGHEFHEGMAFGLMISFANLAESINRLDVEDDIEGLYEGKMQTLSSLEADGFDVAALKSRMETLLSRKNRKTTLKKIARKETANRDLGMRMRVLGMAIHHLGLYARLTRHIMRSVIAQKISNAMEISRLRSEANELERSALSTTVSR